MTSDEDWFAPKRFGFGAGLPIAWQGWALPGGYVTVMVVLSIALAERRRTLFGVMVVVLTLGLLTMAAQDMRSGWRWRWGGESDR